MCDLYCNWKTPNFHFFSFLCNNKTTNFQTKKFSSCLQRKFSIEFHWKLNSESDWFHLLPVSNSSPTRQKNCEYVFISVYPTYLLWKSFWTCYLPQIHVSKKNGHISLVVRYFFSCNQQNHFFLYTGFNAIDTTLPPTWSCIVKTIENGLNIHFRSIQFTYKAFSFNRAININMLFWVEWELLFYLSYIRALW